MLKIPTIMTVDDSTMIRRAVSRVLRRYQCRILEAEDGNSGLSLAIAERPELILLDYNMPMMDGFEMLKNLRGNQLIMGTKIIMLTANSGHGFVKEAVSLGVRDYIVKPFDDVTLVTKVMRQIRLTEN